MRTNVLLGLAAMAAMITTAVAQNVYSVNVVGYVTVTITNNNTFRILATPLGPVGSTNNFVVALFPAPGEGTQVSKLGNNGYETVTFGFGSWDNDLEVPVGTGFFIKLGEPITVTATFVGEVQQNAASNMQIKNGLSLIGSMVPQAGSVMDPLNVPVGEGNQISRLDKFGQYETITYGFGSWDNDLIIDVAEGFFYNNTTGAALPWNRDFVVQ